FTTSLGVEATDLAKIHQPALILLDLDLPDIQGIEVLEQLLNNVSTKSIPVIVVSADAMPHQIEKLIQAGAKDYLTKPLDIVMFLQVIDIYTNTKLF
ncbi:MAG: response regulator, partial [Nitrospira sp.]|nr:response regulator [Nitrospira sp.]